ncbi:hypothetical protein F7725_023429, partial [Dissostichus mawsoni]
MTMKVIRENRRRLDLLPDFLPPGPSARGRVSGCITPARLQRPLEDSQTSCCELQLPQRLSRAPAAPRRSASLRRRRRKSGGVRELLWSPSTPRCCLLALVLTPSTQNPRKQLQAGEEGDVCSICFEPWTTAGEHRLSALRCGHLF